MAKNSSNGEQQTPKKPPPSPSPLRNSKFFQVRLLPLVGYCSFIVKSVILIILYLFSHRFYVIVIFMVLVI